MNNKFKLYLIYIFSFGIAYFVLKNKSKKRSQTTNTTLQITKDIPIDVNKLVSNLGGVQNIKNIESTLNTIKIFVNNLDIIETENIKKEKIKGLLKGNDYISLVVGDYAISLCEEINKIIKN